MKIKKELALVIIMLLFGAVLFIQFWPDAGTAEAGNQAVTEVTIWYEDGTKMTVTPEMAGWTSYSLVDPNQDKIVEKIVCDMYLKAEYSGTLDWIEVTGGAEGYLYNADTNSRVDTLWERDDIQLSKDGSNVPSGQKILLQSISVDAQNIEDMFTNWQDGQQYYYVVWSETDLDVDFEFQDGQTVTEQVEPHRMAVLLEYQDDGTTSGSGLTSVEVDYSGSLESGGEWWEPTNEEWWQP